MKNRQPLSPHIGIYKKVLTAVFSIFHRITGIGLSLGSVFICIWIAFIALGEKYYLIFQEIINKHRNQEIWKSGRNNQWELINNL